ncbi:MAG: hypothetical protein ACJ79H_11240 [Myxococcales bacterium]
MLTTSLLRCRACRLTWFPQAGTGAACPACGGAQVGGTLELFHVGIALIMAGLIGWIGPMVLGEQALPAIPALLQSKELTANVERSPAVSERRSDQVYVPSKKIKSHKVKRAKKAKKRSQHVQR